MDALWRMAMTGTTRAGAGALDLAGHPATALVERVENVDRERQLLLAAGAAAIHDTAGRRSQTGVTTTEPAPADSKPVASSRIGSLLQQLADANEKQLLLELAGRLQSAGLNLPAEFLPTALEYADDSWRAKLRPVLGERGRWLAQFRPEWHWATSDATNDTDDLARLRQQWSEGTHAERRAALTLLHRADPDEARRLLAEVWSTEKADTRGELLAALRAHLTPADEGTLESALDDRAAGVRQIAASLVARLPDSQFTQRMIQRADAMISGKTTGLIRKSLVISCTPPQEVDAALERDGVAAKPPANVGVRAHALIRILAAVRPGHWSQRFFQAEPAAMIAAVAKDDFAEAAIAGWTDAALAFADIDPASAAWLAPLGGYWESQFTSAGEDGLRVALERLKSLLEKMSAVEAEQMLLRLIKSSGIRLTVVLMTLLPLVPSPWSEPFARELLASTRYHVSKFDDDRVSPWLSVLHVAADAIPDPLLTADMEVWTIREGETWQIRNAAKAAERFSHRVQLRRSFLTLIDTEPTN